jgi:hypothetical protein
MTIGKRSCLHTDITNSVGESGSWIKLAVLALLLNYALVTVRKTG